MPDLHRLVAEPELDRPVLVVALEGWIDAGLGAAAAVAHLLEARPTDLVASYDTDELVDHRSRRPVLHLEAGVSRGLTWPAIELRHTTDEDDRDVLVLTGPEPDIRWRAFAGDVVRLAQRFGTRLVVGLGAYPAPLPHTRRGRLATTASSEALAARAGTVHATLDVPAGAQAAVEVTAALEGLPAVGLWAQVPHYASAMSYPAASAMLVDGLAAVAGLRLDATTLHDAGTVLDDRLDQLVADNPEHVAMVRELEIAYDADRRDDGRVPSGEELAAELEAFLRDQGRGGGAGPTGPGSA